MRNKILLSLLISFALTNGEKGYSENCFASYIGVKPQNLIFSRENTFLKYERSSPRQPTGAPPILPNKAYAEDPTKMTYMLEGVGSLAGGTAGGAAAFIVVGIPLMVLSWGTPEGHDSGKDFMSICLVSMGLGIAAGSASGTYLTGKLIKQEGSFDNAFRGSCIGVIVMAALGYGFSKIHLSEDFAPDPIPAILTVSMITIIFAPVPIATVIGYNHK